MSKDRKVVDKDGNEVKTVKLSNGKSLNIAWNVSVDNATHVTSATGVATGNYEYTDVQTEQTKIWHMTVNLGDYSRTNTWYAQVGDKQIPLINLPNAGGNQSLTTPTVNVRPTTVTIGSLNEDDNTKFTIEPTSGNNTSLRAISSAQQSYPAQPSTMPTRTRIKACRSSTSPYHSNIRLARKSR